MKWLREFSTTSLPGVGWDGTSVTYQGTGLNLTSADPFTIIPLEDGTLTIKGYAKGNLAEVNATYSPTQLSFIYKGVGDTTWTSVNFTVPSGGFGGGGGHQQTVSRYVTRTLSLTAGVPIQLCSTTGFCIVKTTDTNLIGSITTYYTGSISTTCPAVIMGNLKSLVVGEDTSQTWSSNNNGLNSLFMDWKNLLDASLLIMPTETGKNYSSLFKGCSNLIQGPRLNLGRDYSNFFEGCTSLRYIEANFDSTTNYNLEDWLKGTENGQRTLYVPIDFDSEFDLHLPTTGWTVEEKSFS